MPRRRRNVRWYRSARVAVRIDAIVERDGEALLFRVARRLDSPNTWRFHWSVGHKLMKWWVHAFETAIATGGGHASLAAARMADAERPRPTCRMRVVVTRQVPSRRNFIRDADDLRYTTKPINDALKHVRLIFDDSERWLEQPTPRQEVSPDGRDWTLVHVAPATEAA